MVIAAGAEESGPLPGCNDVEAKDAMVELDRFLHVGNLQVHMAGAGARRERVRRVRLALRFPKQVLQVQGVGCHPDSAVIPPPLVTRPVAVDFDPIAVRVGEIQGFADQVVRLTDGDLRPGEPAKRPCQGRAAGEQDCEVIEARCMTRGARSRDLLQHDHGCTVPHSRRPERGQAGNVADGPETKGFLVKAKRTGSVSHSNRDRPDERLGMDGLRDHTHTNILTLMGRDVRTRLSLVLMLAVSSALALPAQSTQQPKKGPIVDRVLFDVRMQEDIGLKDTAEGRTDVFLYPVQGNTYRSLPADTQKKLDVYNVPSGSWSLMVNPIPNEAPYTVTVDGREYFNPFAIRDVRYALNFLINRKYIVDEILGGAGGPLFTMATPGQPGTYRYNLIPVKLGMTPTGNEKKAVQDITSALQKASQLPALRGKLVKGDTFWQWNGADLTVKVLIRVDEPNGRLKEGRYIADQIEKAGIRVERLEWDRAKCIEVAYKDDPARYEWNIYTEGWGAGDTRRYWDNIVSQWYAPWQGYQAGGANPHFWRYTNDEIDALTRKVQNGQFKDADEYWDAILRATELGLKEATRIQVSYQSQLFAVNKARFNRRMVYGLGDGLDAWSLITADVKPEKDGEKVLRVTQLSARGSLFTSAWDPVGVDGFKDMYSLFISAPTVDRATFVTPNTAEDAPLRASWQDVLTKVSVGSGDKGEPGGPGADSRARGRHRVRPSAVRVGTRGAGRELFQQGNLHVQVGQLAYGDSHRNCGYHVCSGLCLEMDHEGR